MLLQQQLACAAVLPADDAQLRLQPGPGRLPRADGQFAVGAAELHGHLRLRQLERRRLRERSLELVRNALRHRFLLCFRPAQLDRQRGQPRRHPFKRSRRRAQVQPGGDDGHLWRGAARRYGASAVGSVTLPEPVHAQRILPWNSQKSFNGEWIPQASSHMTKNKQKDFKTQ